MVKTIFLTKKLNEVKISYHNQVLCQISFEKILMYTIKEFLNLSTELIKEQRIIIKVRFQKKIQANQIYFRCHEFQNFLKIQPFFQYFCCTYFSYFFDSINFVFIMLSLLVRNNRYLFAISQFDPKKDYYKTLNLSSTASSAEIKKAFLQLAKKYHPDANSGKESLFKQVNEAYQVLSSQSIKKDYDEARKGSSNQSSGFNNNSSFYQQQRPKSTYRGYSRQSGWNDRMDKEDIMREIFRQQQQQQARNQRAHYGSFSDMYHNKAFQEKYAKRFQQQQASRQQIKRQIQKQERRRQQQFKKWMQQINFKEEIKKKMDSMAQGFTQNIAGMKKVGEFLKDTFKNLKNKK